MLQQLFIQRLPGGHQTEQVASEVLQRGYPGPHLKKPSCILVVKGQYYAPISDIPISLVILNNKVTEPWDFTYK